MFANFEWDPENVPMLKMGIHCLQILLAFVLWCLEIAVFVGDKAEVTGNNGWTFGVCFLSIPAWLYLIMTPRWPRTRKLAEPHAMLAVDAIFTIIWLSAFASQAAYNTANKCGNVCGLSKGIVGLGVIITLLFGASTAVSVYTLRHYRFHGELPGYDKQRIKNDNIDPDKAAFSMAPHDEEAYAPVQMDDHPDHHADTGYGGGGGFNDNPYRPGGGSAYGEDDDPNRYGSLPSRHNGPMFDSETEYNSHQTSAVGGRQSSPNPYGGPRQPSPYAPPTAHDDYDDNAPAQFPSANYNRTLR
ncbi:hypothetical protein VD0004_g2672 [Verticillium dahliae]|uniref:Uncharacterized protein n=1 Tax=Verticillium dahliae TaxID=27337 RepID=A0A366NU96_VERDA|nr:hypothetical protein VD0004_g2672 [Verticillium dahliae]PNH74835.1 hypothetical protein VD0001_g2694 [Verticillium dahliae]RBQ83912.1 hypothetical protein VDGD_08493 [Verticillium dahliae]RXG49195.1 hypothetical protein VDGE_08493 [Verticillium dahliae]